MRTTRLARLTVVALVACGWRERRISGRVTDFASGRPVPGAAVTVAWRGWGRTPDGQIVWDKDHAAAGRTDADGRFALAYRGPASTRLTVAADGFQSYKRWGDAGAVAARLKRRDPAYRPLVVGWLALGEAPPGAGGPLGGWRFDGAAETNAAAAADLIVTAVAFAPRPRATVRATGAGGVRFVPAAHVGVDAELLVYTDTAPADGYTAEATLEPGVRPGVLFVRTRDGARYAKVEVDAAATEAAPHGGRRAVRFRYVYNPAGGRDLRFEAP